MLRSFMFLFMAAFLLQMPETVHAYVGPGAGLSAIGTLLALVAAIVLAIVGFIWYPVKRMLRKFKSSSDQDKNNQ